MAIEFSVRVFSDKSPTDVSVQVEESMESIALTKDAVAGRYSANLDAAPASSSVFGVPMRLIADWPNGQQEQLYVALRNPTPKRISLSVYRDQVAYDVKSLNVVDRLGTDAESRLQKYFRARAIHKYWSFEQNLPDHFLAIRSARIWFAAAADLSKPVASPFRMDEEVKLIMEAYEKRAREDRRFADVFRKYASDGYVIATLRSVAASEFSSLGEIQRLASKGRFEDAAQLNAMGLSALRAASSDTRAAVLQEWKVNVELLEANEAPLAARIEQRRQ
jgi:hypothetical protein